MATADDHGAVAGAEEVAEPPLHLVSIDRDGRVGLLDLVTEEATALGSIEEPSAVATDGRYVLATVPGGIEVVDSGAWTWDHGDHFHYYRAEPALLGTVPGEGRATVATGALSTTGGTGVFFDRTGEAVLLDNEALSDGEVVESFRLRTAPHDGLLVPFGDGAVVTVPDDAGEVTDVRLLDAGGEPVPGLEVACEDARGTITTAVGTVIGCADAALLLTDGDGDPVVERIPYPRGTSAPAATELRAREGRPTVAALAGRTSFWLLDTRERRWQLHDVGVPLAAVVASDDEAGHVVVLDRTGRVRVHAADTGEQLAVTRPLLGAAGPGAGRAGDVDLTVDAERAYLNHPGGGVVHEIDYADGARVARTLRPPVSPAFVAETGR